MPKPKRNWSREELVRQGRATHGKHGRLHTRDNPQLHRRVSDSEHFRGWREFQEACGVDVPKKPSEYSRDELIGMGVKAMGSNKVIPEADRRRLDSLVRYSGHFGRSGTWSSF